MPKTTTGSTGIRLHGSIPGHIVKISEAGHLESVDMEEHGDFTALKGTVDANTAALNDKQNTITSGTNLNINDLSVGNDAILPANLVQHPLKIQQPFLTGADPQNDFGVGIMFRYPRGGGATNVEDQASIDSYYRSAGNTASPYGGLRFTAIDGGGRRTLFDAYQTNPVNNGDSTMEIGLNSQGTLKTRYITLNNTDLATTFS